MPHRIWRSLLSGARIDLERPQRRWRAWFSALDRLLPVVPCVEVVERDDAHLVVFDLPGVHRDDIDIRVEGHHTLIVSGERRDRLARHSSGPSYTERRYGVFSRTIELPLSVDALRMEAALHDGVLEIRLPKLEAAFARSVPIEKVGSVSRKVPAATGARPVGPPS